MILIVVYLGLMITGDIVAYLLGPVRRAAMAGGEPAVFPRDVFFVPLDFLDHRRAGDGAEGGDADALALLARRWQSVRHRWHDNVS